MYADNQAIYGHLTDSSNYDTSHLHNDLYEIFSNRYVSNKIIFTEWNAGNELKIFASTLMES
jgi:hypothetical protein